MATVHLVYEEDTHLEVKHVIGIFFEYADAEKFATTLEKESDDHERELAKTYSFGFIEPEDREWRRFTIEAWNVR